MVQKNTKNVRYYCLLCCAVLQFIHGVSWPYHVMLLQTPRSRIRLLFINTIVLSAIYTWESTMHNQISSLALSHWTTWLLESPPCYFRILSISKHGMHPSVNSWRIYVPLYWHLIVLFFYKFWYISNPQQSPKRSILDFRPCRCFLSTIYMQPVRWDPG